MEITREKLDRRSMRKAIHKVLGVSRGMPPPVRGSEPTLRQDLYALMGKVGGFGRGAEVGVMAGENAKLMLQNIPDLELTLIDPWRRFSKRTPNKWMQRRYDDCRLRLQKWRPIYMRLTSMRAVKNFKDGSLDFVYIDGLHDFDNVIMDLIHWVPKVRKGGIVAGHDFIYGNGIEVPRAVTAYTGAHNINPWYITGGYEAYCKTKEPPSWFWVN